MRLNRLKVKTKLTAKHYRSIRNGVASMYSINQILDAWYSVHLESAEVQTLITTKDARQWVRINAELKNTEKLNNALGRLYADGWVLGVDIGLYKVAKSSGIRKSPTRRQLQNALEIDWDEWTPGNRSASLLLRPTGGLARLLNNRGIKIQEMGRTTLDRIGTRLADGLLAGLSRSQIARTLEDVIEDPERAVIIAGTEMSNAVVLSNLEIYEDSGVEMLEWLVADPCELCEDNYNQSPIRIDEEWRHGEPPVHPNCECDIAPYVVDTGQWVEVYGMGEDS